MDDEEIIAFQGATEELANTFGSDHRFTAEDIKKIHKEIFRKLYESAGEYRNKDLSKDGFVFTRAIFVDELIFIHPFREGNGRAARLLIHLIAQQAGYQGLDFAFVKESGKEYDRYIAAVQAGLDANYEPMKEIIDRALY